MSSSASVNKLFGLSLLSTAYFPPVEYFAVIANSREVLVEKCETFQKQSYRTRCHIYGANGLLNLTIPVLRGDAQDGSHTHKLLIDSVRIDYSKPWVVQHKRAIEAAYMTTPFFEYYKDDLFAVLDSEPETLFELNSRLLDLLCELIGLSTPIRFTREWYSVNGQDGSTGAEPVDFRNRIHPKSKEENLLQQMKIEKPYYQVFSNKQGFKSNLSVLDLLCNEGPNSISFLKA